jgi:hypothetical protein
MYVQRPEAVPPPLPARREQAWTPLTEGVVQEKEPSFFSRLFAELFGGRRHVQQEPLIVAPTPPPVPQRIYTPEPQPAQEPHFEVPIEAAVPSTNAAAEAADREAVLARLRSRVSTYQGQSAPPPTFPTPRPAPLQGAARPARMPSVPGAADVGEAERLRTFSSDFKGATQAGGASAFSILAAQADAPRPVSATVETTTRSHGLAYALGATVLFVGGSLALYFSYTYFAAKSPVSITAAPAALIAGDDSTAISGTGSALLAALAGAANGNVPQGDVRLVYLTVSTSTPTGTVTGNETGGKLISALQLPAPSILLRNIGDSSTVGVIHAGSESRVFFILAATSYERTFAGMLSWEPTIGQDLASLYPSYSYTPPEDTSTSTAPQPVPNAPRFVDETVESHDVRALKDGQGKTILLYGFRDERTLIIARDETSFTQLLARLSASQ